MPRGLKYQIDADPSKAIAAQNKHIAKLDEEIRKLRELGQTGQRAGNRAAQGMDKLLSRAARFVSLAGAIGLARQALQEFAEVRTGAAEDIRQREQGVKQLLQISDTAQQLQRKKDLANFLTTEYGVNYLRGPEVVFQGFSLGLNEEQIKNMGRYKWFAENILPSVVAPGKLFAAFGPQAAGGTEDTVTNAILAAARFSAANISQLSEAVLGPAADVEKLGGTARETIAAVSIAAKALKSVDEAETAVARFAQVIARHPRFKGLGIERSLEKLAGMSESARERIVGENVRARKGLHVLLKNLEDFPLVMQLIDAAIAATGTPESEINRRIRAGRETPSERARFEAQRAEGRRRVEEERLGVIGLQQQTVLEAYRAYAARADIGVAERFMGMAQLRTRAFLGATPEAMARQAYLMAGGLSGVEETFGARRTPSPAVQQLVEQLEAAGFSPRLTEAQLAEQQKTNALLERLLEALPPGTYGVGI